jgi:2-polyprenyl-3-methyl-5-hydroxy-6-metoxy-1,4-benzoquinol methylase
MNDKTLRVKDCQHVVACNSCGADSYAVRYNASYSPEAEAGEVLAQFRSRGGDMLLDQVVQCTRCGLMYINPRLRDDYIVAEYTEAAIHGYKEQFISQNRGREIAFTRSIKMLNKVRPARGRLLDVGAADGTFMAVARSNGWDVCGCEPNAWFCNWGRTQYNITIDQGTLFDQDYPDASFDIITLWDVIEHVPDPRALLARCFSLLRPGGLLVFTYPDIGSWIARLMGRHWVFLMSVHLYYFTRRTVTGLLQSLGFIMLKSSPHLQTLQLGYIVYRMQTHSAALARTSKWFADLLKLNNLMVHYWVGINCIVAKKPDISKI